MKLSKPASLLLLGLLISIGFFFSSVTTPPLEEPALLRLPEQKIHIPATDTPPASPTLNASYACVFDTTSNRILYQKNANQKVPMASTTKIMTAILALEANCLSDTVTVSQKAASMPRVHLGMKSGMQYRMSDLLHSLMLESHNDTAVAIAEHIGHSVEGFASLMNQKAASIGMKQTNFVTPNGLDATNHYSTAYDMCLLAKYAIKNKDFLSLIQTKSHSFQDLSGRYTYSLSNTDAFLSLYDGALGIKTGFTNKAGYCFVGAASRSGVTLTSCVLASGWPPNKSYKWTDTKKLMDFGFENFYPSKFPVQDLSQVIIPVMDGRRKSITVSSLKNVPNVLLSRADSLTITYDFPEFLYAPIRKNTPIATISFYINDQLYYSEKVFPTENIEKSNFSDTIDKVFQIWMEVFGF